MKDNGGKDYEGRYIAGDRYQEDNKAFRAIADVVKAPAGALKLHVRVLQKAYQGLNPRWSGASPDRE